MEHLKTFEQHNGNLNPQNNMGLEIRKVDCKSPIPYIEIGTLIDYSGNYVNGYDEGYSKVVRIYRKDMYQGNRKIISQIPRAIYAQLENGKLILLAFDLNGEIVDEQSIQVLE